MTDEELIATLFVSDGGEVQSFPQHAGQRGVREVRMLTPKFPVGVPPEEQVLHVTIDFHPVSVLPEFAQKAICRLYRERAAAQLLAMDWLHELRFRACPWPVNAEGLNDVVKRSRELEREVDEEQRRR